MLDRVVVVKVGVLLGRREIRLDEINGWVSLFILLELVHIVMIR